MKPERDRYETRSTNRPSRRILRGSRMVKLGSKPTCGVAAFRSGLASLCDATQMAAASPEADPKVLARICDN